MAIVVYVNEQNVQIRLHGCACDLGQRYSDMAQGSFSHVVHQLYYCSVYLCPAEMKLFWVCFFFLVFVMVILIFRREQKAYLCVKYFASIESTIITTDQEPLFICE